MHGSTKRIALALSALTIVIAAATAVLFVFDGVFGPDPVSDALGLLGVVAYAAVGGLVTSRIPRNACGWLLLAIGLGLGLGLSTDVVARLALEAERGTLASWADWANAWLLFATVLPGIVLYLLLFPTGAPPSPRWRPLVVAVVSLAAAGVLVSMVAPADPGFDGPTDVPALADVAEPALMAILLGLVAAGALSVVSIVLRFRRASPTERDALRWIVVVAVVSACLLVVAVGAGVLELHAIGDPAGVLFLLTLMFGLPVSAAVALLRYRAHGAEVVANRSIVYGSLVAVITAIYAVVVGGVGAVVGGGDEPDVFAAVAATALSAVAFQPARVRARRLADRVVYGDRASPYELVATFSERLGGASLGEIVPRMAALIGEGTGSERVAVWLRSGEELRAVAVWPTGRATPSPVGLAGGEVPKLDDPTFPVRHGTDLLGAITVETPPEEPLTPATERLLADLSTQAGLVLRNVALLEELRRSRERLVTSEDEARRRLERDLHDGAQQRLVTLSMDLGLAKARASEHGDAELTTTLEAAERELARSLGELRDLARGIHPAILTQSGLGAAIRSLAERSPVAVDVVTVPEGRFRPEVEATAYFIVSEALANVVKHAGASVASVSVRDDGGRLGIDVTDDGVGGASANGSSGLRGLADRAEAVGGWVEVRSPPGVGTSVRAELPCG